MTVDFSLYGGAESFPEGKRSPRRTFLPGQENNPSALYNFDAPPQDPRDFLWLMTEEPHRTRRMEIMQAHPEVTKLMGHEPLTKYVVSCVATLQIALAIYLRNAHPLSLRFLACAYIIGGTASHNLYLAIHEIAHNLAFKSLVKNKLLAIFANLPIGVPYAASYKRSHVDHHKSLGHDGVDPNLPTSLELLLLNNVFGKLFFTTFYILFFAIRPQVIRRRTPTRWQFYNVIAQFLFDFALVKAFGMRPLIYLWMSSFFAGSLHPLAGHFIAEHFLWDGLSQETYSYYGPLNYLSYNVGYHNEHHDFPSIPWTRLPKLRALAPEFYDTLPAHPSWTMVILNFIRDPEAGLHAQAKRPSKEAKDAKEQAEKEQQKREP